MNFKKLMAVVVLVSALGSTAYAAVGDQTSYGYLNLSGNVPTFFELWVRGVPGDIDLSPNVKVTDRLLGIFHVKYNIDMDSLTLSTTNASGTLEDSNNVAWYPVAQAGKMSYKVMGGAGCKTVGDKGGLTASVAILDTEIDGAGKNVAHADTGDLATNFGWGLEEDCPFVASWTGIAAELPLAGSYSMKVTATMKSK